MTMNHKSLLTLICTLFSTLSLSGQQAQGAQTLKNIKFEVRITAAERKHYDKDFLPWISINNPKAEIARLKDADEKVIAQNTVILVIDYPVATEAHFKLTSPNGFTRGQLALMISEKYHEMYRIEEKTAKQKTIPLKERKGMINRNRTDGKYGIWGHDITDLSLTDLDVTKKKGKIYLILGVDS